MCSRSPTDLAKPFQLRANELITLTDVIQGLFKLGR